MVPFDFETDGFQCRNDLLDNSAMFMFGLLPSCNSKSNLFLKSSNVVFFKALDEEYNKIYIPF